MNWNDGQFRVAILGVLGVRMVNMHSKHSLFMYATIWASVYITYIIYLWMDGVIKTSGIDFDASADNEFHFASMQKPTPPHSKENSQLISKSGSTQFFHKQLMQNISVMWFGAALPNSIAKSAHTILDRKTRIRKLQMIVNIYNKVHIKCIADRLNKLWVFEFTIAMKFFATHLSKMYYTKTTDWKSVCNLNNGQILSSNWKKITWKSTGRIIFWYCLID